MSFASTIDALLLAVAHIQAHYKAIQVAHPHVSSDHARHYPYIVSLEGNSHSNTLSFTYNKRLSHTKLIFAATSNLDGKKLVVKFTRQYSADAHRFLSELDLAPTLYQCVQIHGNWLVIVMDMSPYDLLFGTHLSEPEQAKVQQKAGSILDLLHAGGYVHGDVRDANILVDRESLSSKDGEVKLHLIDFDWAGCVGEAKYPMGVNTVSVRRPAGVDEGVFITKEHDIEMVRYLFKTGGEVYNKRDCSSS